MLKPFAVFAYHARVPTNADTSFLSPILAGRDDAVAVLRREIEQAAHGAGKTILISGEAGIGKSRLLREAKTLANKFGLVVLQGNCFEQDRALPYAPLTDLLRTQAPDLPKESESLESKRKWFELLALALAPHQQNENGNLIIIEDVHWVDEASLEFLLYLARRMGARPALLVMTYRNDEVGPSLERFLAALDRERLASEIELKRLTPTETAAMIRAVFDLSRSPQPEFLAAIHELTNGNPFFIEEVLKSFVSSGEIFELGGQWGRKPLSQLRVPRTVQAAVRQRTEQLSADAQRLLNIAAVAGQRWDFAVLQRLTGHDDAMLIGHIKAMMAAQLVVEESADAFAFRHALTRQAIYTRLLARERAAWHNAIAEALEQLYPQQLDVRLAELAHHFYEAGAWEKALAYARRAGERAQRLGAPRASVEHWTRALDAASHLNKKPNAEMQRARGQAYETLGQFDAARDDFRHALDEARALRDAHMEWRCLLDLGFLFTSRDFQVARKYFDEALAIARSLNDGVALAHTLNRVGNWHVNCEQPSEGERLHREALALFEGLQDAEGIAATLDLLAGALFLGGDLPAGMAHYAQAADRFRAMQDRRGLSSSLVWLTHRGTVLNTMLAAAPAADCAHAGQEALDLAREMDWRAGESFAQVVLGMCSALQGEYDHAFALLQDGIALAKDINHAQGLIVGMFGLGATYLDVMALDEAQRTLEGGLALTRPVNILFGIRLYSALLGLTHIAQGELSKAMSVLDVVIGARPGEMPSQPTLAQRLCWLARAELALAMGNPDEALMIVERLIALAQWTTQDGLSVEPRLLKLRGDALAALGRAEDAETALHEALRVATHQGARPLLWRIRVALGRLCQTQSKRAEAEGHFATSREAITSLAGAIPDEAVRQAFLRDAVADMPAAPNLTPLRAAKLEHDGLTEREREVAVLVARGLSNREIAESLTISQRTAGAHVGNILTKLGFAARAQIAAWVVEKGLL